MKVLLLLITIALSLQANAGSYSNIPASCIKNGINVCYAGHPALNSKHKNPAKTQEQKTRVRKNPGQRGMALT